MLIKFKTAERPSQISSNFSGVYSFSKSNLQDIANLYGIRINLDNSNDGKEIIISFNINEKSYPYNQYNIDERKVSEKLVLSINAYILKYTNKECSLAPLTKSGVKGDFYFLYYRINNNEKINVLKNR